MKTKGELEAAVCEGITHFEQDYMGRGPKDRGKNNFGVCLLSPAAKRIAGERIKVRGRKKQRSCFSRDP